MREPLWKGKSEQQLQKAAVMFHQIRRDSLENARWSRQIAEDAERNLHRIGYGADLVLRQLDSGDPYLLAIEVNP